MTDRRTIIRRRRGYWAIALVFIALLVRSIVTTDGYRVVVMGLVVVCWIFLRRDWIDGGLR